MRDTDKDWSSIAETDPYWGVLSVEDFRGLELPEEARERFFHSGRVFVEHTLALVRRHIDAQFVPRRALDFGCGVGRLLIPLAQHAEEAVGLDIAPRMREIAEANIRSAGISNARVLASDDELSLAGDGFDFVNSFIVLQHIPPERGTGIIEKLIARITIGGVGSLQFTYAKERRFLQHEGWRARFYRREGDTIRDILPRQPGDEVRIMMFDYDLNAVMALVSSYCAGPVLTLPTNHDGHLGVHLLFRRTQ